MLRDTFHANRQERLSDAGVTGQKNYALAWIKAARLETTQQSAADTAAPMCASTHNLTAYRVISSKPIQKTIF